MNLRIELPTGKQDNDGVSRHVAIGKIGRLLDTIDGDAAVLVTVCPPPPKPPYPPAPTSDSSHTGGTSEKCASSWDKKGDYLDSIQHLAMAYARELMSMGIDEPELIVDLLHVASRAKETKGKYRVGTIATHPYQQWFGAGSSVGMTVPVSDGAGGDTCHGSD